MTRHGQWLAAVLLSLGAAGCLGGAADEVGTSSSALTLADVEATGNAEALAAELGTADCVEASREAAALGQDVVWAATGALSEIALCEIDGLVSCAAPTATLDPAERAHIVLLRPVQGVRPDPEPASPDESRPDPEPASPDEARPDPEPASPEEARPDPEPAKPDENRPDPEPATGGTTDTSSGSQQ